MSDLKQMLSSLDVRMSAIQQKHEILEHTPSDTLKPATNRAIAELQAQNKHLRERFEASGKRGLLELDYSVFGAGEKPTKASSSTLQAGSEPPGSDPAASGTTQDV